MSPDPLRQLQDSIVRLLKYRPFYGHFLLQFRRRHFSGNKAVATTITDALPTLLVNPDRYALFSPAEQEALLEHLIKHILHLHPCRRRERSARQWDLACDLAINPGIANLPPEAVLPRRFRLADGLAAEEYYAKLLLIPELGNHQNSGAGEIQAERSGDNDDSERQDEAANHQPATIDDHRHWSAADRTPVSLSEQVVRQMVQSAWQKSHGESPGELQALIDPFC